MENLIYIKKKIIIIGVKLSVNDLNLTDSESMRKVKESEIVSNMQL